MRSSARPPSQTNTSPLFPLRPTSHTSPALAPIAPPSHARTHARTHGAEGKEGQARDKVEMASALASRVAAAAEEDAAITVRLLTGVTLGTAVRHDAPLKSLAKQ